MKFPSTTVDIVKYDGSSNDLPRYLEDIHNLAGIYDVMGALLGPVHYMIRYGNNNEAGDAHVPYLALEKPVLVDDPTPGQVAVYNIRIKEWTEERDSLRHVKTILINTVDDATKLSLSQRDGLAGVTMAAIYAKLMEQAVITASDLDRYKELMTVVFVDDGSETLRTYIADHHERPHNLLDDAGFPIDAPTKIRNLELAMSGILRFELAIKSYKLELALGLRTFSNFVDKLTVADREFPREQTSGGTAMANAAKASHATTSDAQTIRELKAKIAQLERGGGRARGGAGAGVGNDGTVFPHYCHTHGPSTSHSSADCQTPATGHNTKATMKNRMGGREEPYGRGGKK